MVGYFTNENTAKIELWYERIVAWRIETVEITDRYQDKKGQLRVDTRLVNHVDPITAEGDLTYDHSQYAAVKEPTGRLFSSGMASYENEQVLINELTAEQERRKVRKATNGL